MDLTNFIKRLIRISVKDKLTSRTATTLPSATPNSFIKSSLSVTMKTTPSVALAAAV